MKDNILQSLYIHYPFCAHLCNYCDFYKKVPKGEKEIEHFEHYLRESISKHQKLMETYGYRWGSLKTLYLGGGTPSLWGKRGSLFLKQIFQQYGIYFEKQHEWTLEVNPKEWNPESIDQFIHLGVNRFSIGIQSMNNYYLQLLDRIHTVEDIKQALSFFNKNKLHFSVDLMLGLPNSKKRHIRDELKFILDSGVEHISLYILTINKYHKYYKELPEEDFLRDEYLSASEFLEKNDYHHYEVSNFARPGRESKHNLRYWHLKSVAALGPSAVGFLSEKGIRYKWDVGRKNFNIETLTKDNKKLEEIYLGLRTRKGIERERLNVQSSTIETWDKMGYLQNKEDIISLSSLGYLMIDSLMNDLFCRPLKKKDESSN